MLLFRVIKERETAHEVRRTSVLRGPKPTSCYGNKASRCCACTSIDSPTANQLIKPVRFYRGGLRPRTWYEF